MPSSKRRRVSTGAAGAATADASTSTAGPVTSAPASRAALAESNILEAAGITTSEDVIKALKAAAEPVSKVDGAPLSRAAIATAAWEAPESKLFFPKKAEVLGDWALSALIKQAKSVPLDQKAECSKKAGKRKSVGSDASDGNASEADLFGSPLWSLLTAVTASAPDGTVASDSRIASTLAARNPVLPFLHRLLAVARAAGSSLETRRVEPACTVMARLLHSGCPNLARASMSTEFDVLQQSLLLIMQIELTQAQHEPEEQALLRLVHLHDCILQLWHGALDSGSNRKKAYTFMLEDGLDCLAALLGFHSEQTSASQSLQNMSKLARIAAVEALLNANVLQSVLQQRPGVPRQEGSMTLTALLEAVSARPASGNAGDDGALDMLWELLPELVKRLRASSESQTGDAPRIEATVSDLDTRTSVLHAFIKPMYRNILRQGVADTTGQHLSAAVLTSEQLIRQIRRLSEAVLDCELYKAGTQDATQGWSEVLQSILDGALTRRQVDSRLLPDDLRTVQVMWTLDSNLASSRLQQTLKQLLFEKARLSGAPADQGAETSKDLFDLLLNMATRQRSVPDLLFAISASAQNLIEELCPGTGSGEADAAAQRIIASPVFAPEALRDLRHTIRHSVSSLQVVDLLSLMTSRCTSRAATFCTERSAKAAALLNLEYELASHVIAEVELAPPVRDDAVALLHQLLHVEDPGRAGVKQVFAQAFVDPSTTISALNAALHALIAVEQLRQRLEDDEAAISTQDAAETTDASKILKRDLSPFHDILAELEKVLESRAVAFIPGQVQLCDSVLQLLQMAQEGVISLEGRWQRLAVIVLRHLTHLSRPESASAADRFTVWNTVLLKWPALLDASANGDDEAYEALRDAARVTLDTLADGDDMSTFIKRVATSAAFLELPIWRKAINEVILSDRDAKGKASVAAARRLETVADFPSIYFERSWEDICKRVASVLAHGQRPPPQRLNLVLTMALSQGEVVSLAQLLTALEASADSDKSGAHFILAAWTASAAAENAIQEVHAALQKKAAVAGRRATAARFWQQSLVVFYESLLDKSPQRVADLCKGLGIDDPANEIVDAAAEASQSAIAGDAARELLGWRLRDAAVKMRVLRLLRSTEGIKLSAEATRACVGLVDKLLDDDNISHEDGQRTSTAASLLPLFHLLRLVDAQEENASVITPAYARASALGQVDDRLRSVYIEHIQQLSSPLYEGHVAWVMQHLEVQTANHGPAVQSLCETLAILLTHSPEATGETVRAYTQVLLTMACNRMESATAVLTTIRDVCQNKTILLGHQHVDLLLLLMSELVSPRKRDSVTSLARGEAQAVFLDITSILSILVRQRRDLLLGKLSHLSIIVGRMFSLLRASRPRLGAAQLRAVHRGLPFWLDAQNLPLEDTCARALARLLSSITARTTTLAIRSKASADSEGKVDSLAKPFARHAVHVLVAYIRTLLASGASSAAAGATFVPGQVQRALEPGLFAMCDITSGHDRDAALVGMLDAAEKTLFKRLLSGWESQRYKGQ